MDYKEFRDNENEKIDYALEDHLDIDYDILIKRRWDVAQDWDTSKVPARKSIQETIKKIEDRIENIFLELYKNKFQLSNKMKNFTRYNYSDGLKGSILYTDNHSSGTPESLKNINSAPLTYKKVESLLINLKDNDYKPTEIEKTFRNTNRSSRKDQNLLKIIAWI